MSLMKCDICGCVDSKVVDSRLTEDGTAVRRRRACAQCGQRITTYERSSIRHDELQRSIVRAKDLIVRLQTFVEVETAAAAEV